MATLKRKQDEADIADEEYDEPYNGYVGIDEDDDEEPSFGKQILPVANLPDDFADEPADGLQYLFTVRREGRTLPHITRVSNPYEQPEIPVASPRRTVAHPSIPTQEWRTIYENRFRGFRKNLSQPTIHVELPSSSDSRKVMPDKIERDCWWAFLAGQPESEWKLKKKGKQKHGSRRKKGMRAFDDPDAESVDGGETTNQEVWYINDEGEVALKYSTPPASPGPPKDDEVGEASAVAPTPPTPPIPPILIEVDKHQPREPTMSLLKHIDERTALHLLMYFTHWMNFHSQQPETPTHWMTESHARWMFALLTRIDDHISADDMSLLRNLARACIGTLKTRMQARISNSSSDDVELGEIEEASSPKLMSERDCWMIIATVVGIWAQRDLWTDAEDAVAGVIAASDSTGSG
ncbi:hypothetical protein BDN72DRAFT_895363 [Pluteus cervinus]|uniref:Uncharacterized protein n=1 Tax=Pluteus cervinus TaxID=181527 RepID=A0ACD3B2J8_9AGAR|nr:hypothetical protein BDN72DRAFT_895363 [Pluteus cervinus]